MNWLASILHCFRFPKQNAGINDLDAKDKYQFSTIHDNYRSIEEVQQGLREAGLESSNLIIGIDFTKSNTWTGQTSFQGRCLHDTTGPPNPYQQVIGIVGRTLEVFDDDHLIPAYGFGDAYTTDKSCFPFFPDRPCNGLGEVLARYQDIAPGLALQPRITLPTAAGVISVFGGRDQPLRANQFRSHHRQGNRDGDGRALLPHTRAHRRRAGPPPPRHRSTRTRVLSSVMMMMTTTMMKPA